MANAKHRKHTGEFGLWLADLCKEGRRILFFRATLILMGFGLMAFSLWGWVPTDISGSHCKLAKNGAWISVDWTSQPVDEVAVAQLVEHASHRGIRYLFPFTTYLKADGSFSPSYDYAREFVATFRRFSSEQVLLAWIGVPLENEGLLGIEGTVDLTNESTREAIVALAVALVEDAGFDGVHLDVETVRSENDAYLLLLEEVKAGIGDRTLSVAGSYWLPQAVNGLPVLERFKWENGYYQEVAERVDQIVTMTYDSGMPLAALYRLWMREQMRGIGRSLAHSNIELLMGLSVSREKTLTHRPRAENMQSGLAGICGGLSRYAETGAVIDGVAVYAAWEADGTDWKVWERWVNDTQTPN